MELTKSFKQLVQSRVASAGINTLLTGDVDTGKAILRDYIKATVGFEKPGAAIGTRPKCMIRMFGSRANPQACNLFACSGSSAICNSKPALSCM